MIQENEQQQYKTPAQAVKKSFLRQFVDNTERERFRNVLSVLLTDLDSRERGFQQRLRKDFFRVVFLENNRLQNKQS